jgi:general secretion pathway protein G
MRRRGFTLIELSIGLAILGILATIGATRYDAFIDRVRIAEAVVDIRGLQNEVMAYEAANGEAPDTLAQGQIDPLEDPWGRPYQYLKIVGPGPGSTLGKARKDRFLVPINSRFDLYSMGEDGQSKPPLNAKASRDDVIRANDGSYLGLAERY